MATEKQIREQLIEIAVGWLGCTEMDGSHKKIIDVYNGHRPLARGYKVTYTDAWCATYGSAVAIKAGFTDIIPTECGCQRQINLAIAKGIWVEDDAYVPNAGDYIFYDWQDSGIGDNMGHADHVGIVVSVSGNTIKVIEGNINRAVGYRNIAVNGKFIRGYMCPKYASKASAGSQPATNTNPTTTNPTTTNPSTTNPTTTNPTTTNPTITNPSITSPSITPVTYNIGDTVNFTGSSHYTSSFKNAAAKGCKAGLAKVTNISANNPYPYHLQAVPGKGSTVYGWVCKDDISSASAAAKTYTVVKGDTLLKIAKQFGTTVDALVALNGIQNRNLINVGQVIRLP